MAATKTSIAPDSATDLHDLIGDDATATFESDPKFIDSDPTESASSGNIAVQRDTDDVEDSTEEDDELEDEDDDEEYEDEEEDDEDYEDEDEDEDEEDEDEDGVAGMAAAEIGGNEVSSAGSSEALEDEEDEDDDADFDSDAASTDRVVDAALRMNAMVAVFAEFAANI